MTAGAKLAVRKVCGLTRPEDALHAASCGANALGMIFYAGSPRAVSAARAAAIADGVPHGVRRVGVFVDEDPATIADTVGKARLNVVQLHGNETPRLCGRIREKLPPNIEIWKAVRVGAEFRASALADFRVDAFLLDTARPGSFGGTGETFPWARAAAAGRYGRIIVSGGLDGANAAEAVRRAAPWGVDASSRLESEPGIKDPRKVRAFLAAAASVPDAEQGLP